MQSKDEFHCSVSRVHKGKQSKSLQIFPASADQQRDFYLEIRPVSQSIKCQTAATGQPHEHPQQQLKGCYYYYYFLRLLRRLGTITMTMINL